MDLEGIRNGGFEGKMGTKTSERLVQANSFFSAKKVTSRFLGNEIMIFMYFYVFLCIFMYLYVFVCICI